jgi:pectin methylesterase-like acyl-CoA thioesterase
MKKFASLFHSQFPSVFRGRRVVGRVAGNLCLLGLMVSAVSARAGSVNWVGGIDTNWSTGGNWSPAGSGTAGVPGPTDNVVFGTIGASPTSGAISNYVDGVLGNFAGTIGSLQYTNAANFQNTLIAPTVTLNVTGATVAVAGQTVAGNALMVGEASTSGAVSATISGPGAALNASNSAAEFIVSQGGGTALLDMTNLDNFTGHLSRLGVGVPPNYGWNVISATPNGVLRLAKTNFIATSFAGGTGGSTVNAGFTSWTNVYGSGLGHEIVEAIEVGNGADTSISGTSSGILLGLANTFNIDSIGVGKSKSAQSSARQFLTFNPVFTNSGPSATFRGTNGGSSRVAFWSIGDNATSGNSSTTASGLVDFTGGTVDARVDQMYMGIDKNTSTGSGPNMGTLTFTSGTVDINTLVMGAQESPNGTTAACAGVVNVSGATATLVVNSNMALGSTVLLAAVGNAATGTFGTLNVTNGTVTANNITACTTTTSTKNAINLLNATLTVTNSLATNAGTLNLTMTNSTLGLTVPANGSLPALVKTLTAGGTTNLIQLAPVPVFASYPQLIPLVQYTTLSGSFNFGLANVPASAPGAYLSNITIVPKSIALYLPSSPAPVINSQPGPFSGTPGTNATFTVSVSGDPTLVYQWYETDGVSITNLLTDTANATGSTNSGSATSSLTILNAQPGDNGGYFVVITNGFGAITSAVAQLTISSGNVPPSIAGLTDQTVIAGNTAIISASVSGSPTPTLQWQFNGTNLMDGPTGNGDTISGSATSTLSVINAQYPSSQGQYSLIASNVAGVLTNSMTLTVTVTPAISVQPVSLVVTNTQSASFSVTASGVPAPTYQWKKNGLAMSSVTNPTAITSDLVISSTQPSDTATYTVLVSNSAGSILSSPATLTVNSTMVATPLSPTNGATGVCYDTPLYLNFDRPPTLNNQGNITIYDASTSLPVDTINMTLGSPQNRTIGGVGINTYPVIITGNTAAIYPHSGVMTFNKTYYVTIDDGVFADSVGAYFAGITDTNAWRFTTKPTGPANSTNLVVAADGSGDFLTVQGAADFIPNGNTNHVLVNIRNGTYTEVVRLNSKNNVTFRGQDRQQTIVTYANNNNINGSTSTRPMFGVLAANDVAIENITLTNSTPKGGSQAETLYLNVVKRFILNNAFLASYQDTLLVNANGDQAYFNNNLIQGDTDFIWGEGTAFFTNCELRTLTSGSGTNLQNVTQARTTAGTNGFSFVDCQLTRLNNTITLGGLGRSLGFTDGNVAYINCLIDAHIVGWQDSLARSWEFGNSNITATAPVSYNGVQLAANDPNLTNAETATLWLYGWQPQLAPNIITQPVPLSVSGGQLASFSVTATGIPNASYQWLKNGNVITNQTGSTLTIASAYAGDAASYSVIVSNLAGAVTSDSASLTVGNTAPTLNPIGDAVINAGQTLIITNVASDPDVPTQTLSFSLLTAPATAAIDTNSGVFTWRPSVSDAGTINPVTVQVSDNGTPVLSASQSFNVTVNPLVIPALGPVSFSGGQFSLTVGSGTAGPDYTVQFSTDLTNWATIYTTNSATPPFTFVDTNAPSATGFYRVLIGP